MTFMVTFKYLNSTYKKINQNYLQTTEIPKPTKL